MGFNQIPDELGESEEEKMLKCIKSCCQNGVTVIHLLLDELDTKTAKCKKCGHESFHTKRVGPHLGLYCSKCGSWQKWVRVMRPVEETTMHVDKSQEVVDDSDIPF